jgi:hypothetical protein
VRRPTAAALLLVVLAGAGAATGCQKVTKTVTTSVSPCFRVLPEAHAAVGNQGAFVDVARLQGERVTTFPRVTETTGVSAPSSTAPGTSTTVAAQGRRDVCVVAYRGTFDPTRIQHLLGAAPAGRYAIVIVGVRTREVRAVLLTDTLPKPLRTH